MPHADSDPVNWGDLRRAYKKLDERISECFAAFQAGDEAQSEFWDEHQEQIGRLRRSLNRLRRDLNALRDEE